MRHEQFKYVDLAINGARNRNNAVSIDEMCVPPDAVDCYTTVYRFDSAFQKLVKETGSVRGADQLPCWTDSVHFDIDHPDVVTAFSDALELLRNIAAVHEELATATAIYFSGNKGIHLHMPVDGLEPSVVLPRLVRTIANRIAGDVTIDSVYEHSRLWRIPGTIHSATELRKTQLTREELEKLANRECDIAALCEDKSKLVSQRVHVGGVELKKVSPAAWHKLQQLIADVQSTLSANHVPDDCSWDVPPTNGQVSQYHLDRLEVLLSHGCNKSSGGGVDGKGTGRDNGAFLRAVKCIECGFTREQTWAKMAAWNKLNNPPLSLGDLKRIVHSAIEGKHDIGFSDKFAELQAAHDIAKSSASGETLVTTTGNLRDALASMPKLFECGGILAFDVAELIKVPQLTEPPQTALLGSAVIGSNTILAGDSGTGKSTFVRSAVIQEAQKGKRTLWISAESERRFTWWFNRMYPYLKNGQIIWVDTRFTDRDLVPAGPKRWEALRRVIQHCKCDFVVIDTLLSVLTWLDGDVPKNEGMAEWGTKIQQLGDVSLGANSTPLILHHTNRSGTYALSVGIKNGCDNMWLFRKVGGGNEDLRELTVDKTRDGVTPYKVVCDPNNNYHYSIRDADTGEQMASGAKYTEKEQAVISALIGGEAIATPQLTKRTGIDRKRLNETLKKLNVVKIPQTPGKPHLWRASQELIEKWRQDGVQPNGSAADLIN